MKETANSDPTKHQVNDAFELPNPILPAAIKDAFHGALLTRSLRLSFDLNKIAIAFVGLFILQLSWSVLDASLLDLDTTRRAASLAVISRWGQTIPADPFTWFARPINRLLEPILVLVNPLLSFITFHPFDAIGIHSALTGLATIAIWGVAGGAIARIALLQVGWGRGLGAKAALHYTIAHVRPLVATPLLPILVLLITDLFCGIFGLLFRLPWFGELLAGLLLPIPICLGLLMFIVVIGLASGWPLMVASVAAEGEDELDAVSRSFSYINHRLVSYFCYAGIALIIGIPGIWFVDLIARGTLLMAEWGLGLTVPNHTVSQIFALVPQQFSTTEQVSIAPSAENSGGGILSAFWIGCVGLAVRSWSFSYFWTSISLIYLIMRKDVDGAEWSLLKPDPIDENTLPDESESKLRSRPADSKLTEPPMPIPLSEESEPV